MLRFPFVSRSTHRPTPWRASRPAPWSTRRPAEWAASWRNVALATLAPALVAIACGDGISGEPTNQTNLLSTSSSADTSTRTTDTAPPPQGSNPPGVAPVATPSSSPSNNVSPNGTPPSPSFPTTPNPSITESPPRASNPASTSSGTGGAPNGGAGGEATSGSGGSILEDPPAAGSSSGGTSGAPDDVPEGGSAGDDPMATDAGTDDGCPFAGNVEYRLNGPENWPSDVVDLLTAAMDEAVYYYNCYADLSHSLTVNYNESVPTAEANVDGWMSFGSDRGYMVVATAMHEVAHTMGVGYFPWTELMNDGRWVGPHVVEFMTNLPPEQKDPDMYSQRDYITGDQQHFWPYGLNQASEHQSEWSLINHVRIVAAMQEDKQAYRDGSL